MTTSAERRLIAAYATLAVLLNASVLLPGDLRFASAWGFVGSVAIQALLVWRLWHGSPFAWLFGLVMALLTPVTVFLTGGPANVATVIFTFLSLAQAGILVTPPISTLVWSREKAPVASS